MTPNRRVTASYIGRRSSTASPAAARVQTSGHTAAAPPSATIQFPPSDGDCHAPLPCEGAYTNNTTQPACRLYVQGAQDAAAVPGGYSQAREADCEAAS